MYLEAVKPQQAPTTMIAVSTHKLEFTRRIRLMASSAMRQER